MAIERRVGMSRGQLRAAMLRRLVSAEVVMKVESGEIALGPGQTIDDRLGQCGSASVGHVIEVLLDHQEEMGKLLKGVNEALTMKLTVSQRVDKNNSAIGQLGERAQGADDGLRVLREYVENELNRIQVALEENEALTATNAGALGTWTDRFSEQIVGIAADATQALEKVDVVETMSEFVRGTDRRVLVLEQSSEGLRADLIEQLAQSQAEAFLAQTGHLAETAQRLDERINALGETINVQDGGANARVFELERKALDAIERIDALLVSQAETAQRLDERINGIGEVINRHDSRIDDLDSICADLIVDVKRIKKRAIRLEEDDLPTVISGVGKAMDLISNLATMAEGLGERINLNRQALDIHDDRFSNQSEMVNAHEEGLTNQAVMGRDQAIAIDDVNHDIQGLNKRITTIGERVLELTLKLSTETDHVNLNARMDSLYDRAKVLWDEMIQRTDANEAGLIGLAKRITEAKTNIIKVVDEINTLIADLNAQLGGHDSNIQLTPKEDLRRPISHIPSPTGGLSQAEAMEAGGDDSEAWLEGVDVAAIDETVNGPNFIHATGSPEPLGELPWSGTIERRFHIPEPTVEEAQLRARLEERLTNFKRVLVAICHLSSPRGRRPYGVEILGTRINEKASRALQADKKQAEFTGLKATSDLLGAIARGNLGLGCSGQGPSPDLETTQLALEDNERLRNIINGISAYAMNNLDEEFRIPVMDIIEDGVGRERVTIHEGNPSSGDAPIDWRDIEETPMIIERGSDGEVQGVTQWENIQATANARRDSDRADHEG